MPTVLDRLTRRLMLLRGYREELAETPAGPVRALVWEGPGPLPPLTMLHGWGSAGVHQVLVARRIRRRVRRLVLPDLPGHGFSTTPAPMTQDALREGIQRGLPRLQGAPGVVLGSSFGGFTAIRYALARPDLVTGLILVSPFGAPMTPGELDRCVRLLRAQSLADAKEFLDDVAVRPWSGHWLLAPGVRRMLHRRPLLELLEHVHQTPWLTAEELARVQVPVTVVWGRHETLFPESHVDFWRQLPGVRLVRPPRSAHAPSVDEPARFERIVLEHLEAVRTRPGPPHAPQIAERLANR